MLALPLVAALNIGQVSQPIINGTASDASEDATVMLFHLEPGKTRGGICTGALIAPNLVLTARHCVSRSDDNVACDEDGNPLIGGNVIENFEAVDLYVFAGKDRAEFTGTVAPALDATKWKPSGQGLEIIDDKSGTLCNHDLALVLLKAPIENVPIASIRLDGDARVGEKLLTVGWGVTSGEIEPKMRQRRDGVTVQRVGPNGTVPVLTKSEFLFDESICLGDSGGPVYADATKAIIGVVSRGGNGVEPGGGPASTCVQADNLATKLSPFRELIMDGFHRAGAEPKLEPQEDEEDSCLCAHAGMGGSRRVSGVLVAAAIGLTLLLRRGRRRWTDG
jgi:hypothetical protein